MITDCRYHLCFLQAKAYHDSLDRRISALESLRQTEAPQLPETTTD